MSDHDALRERLQSLLDDELSPGERALLGRHLAACAPCRAELAQLRALAKRAAELPAEIPPARDLWPGIVARIGAEGVERVARAEGPARAEGLRRAAAQDGARGPGPLPIPAGAAASLRRRRAWVWPGGVATIAAAAAIALILLARGPGPNPERPANPSGAAPGIGSLAQAGLRDLEAAGKEAEAGYAAALQARGALPASMADAISLGLAAIDRSIDETRTALAAAPLDPGLLRLLTDGYQNRIGLLQRATRLSARL